MQINTTIAPKIASFIEEESGGTFMEYTLIVALALVVCALLVLALQKLTLTST